MANPYKEPIIALVFAVATALLAYLYYYNKNNTNPLLWMIGSILLIIIILFTIKTVSKIILDKTSFFI